VSNADTSLFVSVAMSLRYDSDMRPSSPTSYPYNSSSYLPFSSDINYVNYTLLDSAAVVDPSLTSFHLNDANSSSSSSYHDRYSHLQSPPKRRYLAPFGPQISIRIQFNLMCKICCQNAAGQ